MTNSCVSCDSSKATEKFSLGIECGAYCEECWEKSSYRKDASYIIGQDDNYESESL